MTENFDFVLLESGFLVSRTQHVIPVAATETYDISTPISAFLNTEKKSQFNFKCANNIYTAPSVYKLVKDYDNDHSFSNFIALVDMYMEIFKNVNMASWVYLQYCNMYATNANLYMFETFIKEFANHCRSLDKVTSTKVTSILPINLRLDMKKKALDSHTFKKNINAIRDDVVSIPMSPALFIASLVKHNMLTHFGHLVFLSNVDNS